MDNALLHRVIENRHSPVYSSLYMSFFLISYRKFIFGIQNDNDKLYCGIDDQLCPFVLPYICYLFFLSILFYFS